MLDEVRIERLGEPETDTEGNVTVPRELIYSGPARWIAGTTASTETDVGTAAMAVTPSAVHIPARAGRQEPGDVATCVTCRMLPDLVGVEARIVAVPAGSHLTAIRLAVEETS